MQGFDFDKKRKDNKSDNKNNSKVIAIDFDGTCVYNDWPKVGPDIYGCEEVLKKLVENGHKLILLTQRSKDTDKGDILSLAIKWFNYHNIKLYGVNKNPDWDANPDLGTSRKVYADVYIDDHNAFMPVTTDENDEGEPIKLVYWPAIDAWFVKNHFYDEYALDLKNDDMADVEEAIRNTGYYHFDNILNNR